MLCTELMQRSTAAGSGPILPRYAELHSRMHYQTGSLLPMTVIETTMMISTDCARSSFCV